MEDAAHRAIAVVPIVVSRQEVAAARHTVTAVDLGPVAVKQAAYLPEPRAVRMAITAMPGTFAVAATTEVVHHRGRNVVGAGDTAKMETDALFTEVGRAAVPVASVDRVMAGTSYRAQVGRRWRPNPSWRQVRQLRLQV